MPWKESRIVDQRSSCCELPKRSLEALVASNRQEKGISSRQRLSGSEMGFLDSSRSGTLFSVTSVQDGDKNPKIDLIFGHMTDDCRKFTTICGSA
jgi:hypothetical protein